MRALSPYRQRTLLSPSATTYQDKIITFLRSPAKPPLSHSHSSKFKLSTTTHLLPAKMKFTATLISLTALAATAFAAPAPADPVEKRDCRGEVDVRASCWNQFLWAFDTLDNCRGGNRDGVVSRQDLQACFPSISPGVCTTVLGRDWDAADNMRLGGARDGLVSYPDAQHYLHWMSYCNQCGIC
ncbi:hypothetical protein V8F20_012854 [Naviculisporaceae sp. PSN 640]